MNSDDLSKTNPDDWIAMHFFVDDPKFFPDIKKIMDTEITTISDKLNGWFFAHYTKKDESELLTQYRYKLILWKKSNIDADEIVRFFKNIASTKLNPFLHQVAEVNQNSDNPDVVLRYGGADKYGKINDLYLSCFANKIRLQMVNEFKLEFDENQLAFTLHMMFNQLNRNGYLCDLIVASKLSNNALLGMGFDPILRKDN